MNCPICLEDDTDYVTVCQHRFHAVCLRAWFNLGNRTCPVCRRILNTPTEMCLNDAKLALFVLACVCSPVYSIIVGYMIVMQNIDFNLSCTVVVHYIFLCNFYILEINRNAVAIPQVLQRFILSSHKIVSNILQILLVILYLDIPYTRQFYNLLHYSYLVNVTANWFMMKN
jgi:hypothetical protein